MDESMWGTMMVIKEVLAALNNTGKSKDDERIRQIVRDVLSETRTTSASERDMVNNMMQLLQQNMTKQTVEKHTAADEKEQYKAKLDELSYRMDQLMKDRGSQASGGEGSGLTGRQKKLVEMLEELKAMRETKRTEQGRPGKPFNREGGRGWNRGDYSHREQQDQGSAAFSKFDRQNKNYNQFYQGKHSYNQKAENFETADPDFKSGGLQGKSFHQDNLQKGPMTFQKKFPQCGERDERQDFDPRSKSMVDGYDHSSQYRHRQGDSGPTFGNRAGVQNMRMQHKIPYKGSSQHRDTSQHRDQYQRQPHGQFHASRGHFRQNRWQFQHHGQGQGSDPSSYPKELNQFTPEEIDAIKAVLKQQQQDQDEKTASTPLVVNPSKKASKKKKKKPEGPKGLKPDDSDTDKELDYEVGEPQSAEVKVKSSAEDGESSSADLGATTVDTTTDEKNVTESDKVNKKKGRKSKNKAASPNKPEDLSPLELFMASGFDLSQIANLSMDEKVNDMMLIAKEDGKIVPCQPNTVGELIEFKRKYPNAQAIIVKTSEQN